jgi:hypothetical protein
MQLQMDGHLPNVGAHKQPACDIWRPNNTKRPRDCPLPTHSASPASGIPNIKARPNPLQQLHKPSRRDPWVHRGGRCCDAS